MATQRKMKTLLIVTTVAGAAFGGSLSAAMAQSAETAPDLRTLYATPMDIADGKQLASMGCASCHGADGISSKPDTPHIAGQRPAYLYRALKDYKTGDRNDRKMRDAIKFLSDDALIKVAAYYASARSRTAPRWPRRAG